MNTIKNLFKLILISSFLALVSFTGGCTRKPHTDDLTRLEEARSAAESAERKLSELRQERKGLEDQLAQKEAELKEHEQERNEIREKMENQ